MNAPGVLVFEFMQAATAATVAQRFPLLARHFAQALALPKWPAVGDLALLRAIRHRVIV